MFIQYNYGKFHLNPCSRFKQRSLCTYVTYSASQGILCNERKHEFMFYGMGQSRLIQYKTALRCRHVHLCHSPYTLCKNFTCKSGKHSITGLLLVEGVASTAILLCDSKSNTSTVIHQYFNFKMNCVATGFMKHLERFAVSLCHLVPCTGAAKTERHCVLSIVLNNNCPNYDKCFSL